MRHFAQFLTSIFVESAVYFKGQQSLGTFCKIMPKYSQRMYKSITEAPETNKEAVLMWLEIIFGM